MQCLISHRQVLSSFQQNWRAYCVEWAAFLWCSSLLRCDIRQPWVMWLTLNLAITITHPLLVFRFSGKKLTCKEQRRPKKVFACETLGLCPSYALCTYTRCSCYCSGICWFCSVLMIAGGSRCWARQMRYEQVSIHGRGFSVSIYAIVLQGEEKIILCGARIVFRQVTVWVSSFLDWGCDIKLGSNICL